MGDDYAGREQTQLKHMVLDRYLSAWGMKLAHTTTGTLWFVDCFAGPWRSENEQREDTSVAIALKRLRDVQERTGAKVGAIFVEKDRDRFHELLQFLIEEAGPIGTQPILGTFTEAAPTIQNVLRTDAAFVFVDPTGIKGADMHAIASLVKCDRRHVPRDVMVNFMFDFLNRFKGEATREQSRRWLIEQYESFFGDGDVARLAKMNESELVGEYRTRLKALCGFQFCLSLAVPKPTARRTYFHLVLGARNPAAVKLFRDTEKQVIGGKAEIVLSRAKARKALHETGQHPLFAEQGAPNVEFDRLRRADLEDIEERIVERLHEGPTQFKDVWPVLLEELHVTLGDVKRAIENLKKAGKVELLDLAPRQRSPKDDTWLSLSRPGRRD